MAEQVHTIVMSLMRLTFGSEALWIITPLFMATVVMLVYFERYRYERPGWNTLTANSLVLLFVSVDLLRFIFNLTEAGAINYVLFPGKTVAAAALFVLGTSLLRFNFNHLLPEKVSQYISSPLTLSVVAYIAIIYVFTEIETSIQLIIALTFILSIVLLCFALLKIPIEYLMTKVRKIKENEKIENIKEEKQTIRRLRIELDRRERDIQEATLRNIKQQKKEVKKLKEVAKKV